MLPLVIADRNLVRVVGQDVRGHEDRIEEEAGRDELLLSGLLLELGHPAKLAVRGHARQQPTELGVFLDVGLPEQDAALGVEARGQQNRSAVVHARRQVTRVVGDGDRMEIDETVDRLAPVLPGDVLPDPPDVVPEVEDAGRLDAREDAHAVRVPEVPGRPSGT